MDSNQNFSLKAGNYKKLIITVTKDDGTPKDLTTAQLIKWQIFRNQLPILKKDLTTGITSGNGLIQIELLSTDTTTFNGTYQHECFATDSTGIAETLFEGTITFEQPLIQ